MPETRSCLKCGAAFSVAALEGLCPDCVGRLFFTREPGADVAATPASIQGNRLRYFGDYEMIEEVARGGMGVVYRARQLSLNRIVAVKMILAGQLASPADVQRFRAEAEAAANLQHPNIVAIHEIGEHQGQHYFSMDYVEGKNLAQLISDCRLRITDFGTAARYVKIIAEAIHYAHQQGTLHRDLKPSNVLIDPFDQPRITDFGLARRLNDPQLSTASQQLTVTGQVLGTPNFMPPEQASAKRDAIGPHSDVYSLGAILYFLLTGRPPFTAQTIHETVTQVLNAEPDPPRALNPAVPRDLQTICLKCLEKDPRCRYASAKELAEDLDRFLQDRPILARPIGPARRMWRRCLCYPVAAALALALAITVTALLVLLAIISSARPIVPMPVRSGNGISAVIDGKIYLTAPMDGLGGGVGHFYAYDPARNAWLHALEATPLVHKNPCGGSIGRKFYLAGGLNQKNVLLDRLDIYDSDSGNWSAGAPVRSARVGAASAVLGGKLYLLGGFDDPAHETNLLASVEFYDPATDHWAAAPPLPTARAQLGAAVIGRTLYAVAGKDAPDHRLGNLDALGPDGAWTTLAPLPQPVAAPFVAAAGGVLYVAGGEAAPDTVVATLQAYSVETGKWTILAPMPEPRFSGCGAQWINGELYVMGGWTYRPPLPHDDVFVYDPKRNAWRR